MSKGVNNLRACCAVRYSGNAALHPVHEDPYFHSLRCCQWHQNKPQYDVSYSPSCLTDVKRTILTICHYKLTFQTENKKKKTMQSSGKSLHVFVCLLTPNSRLGHQNGNEKWWGKSNSLFDWLRKTFLWKKMKPFLGFSSRVTHNNLKLWNQLTSRTTNLIKEWIDV